MNSKAMIPNKTQFSKVTIQDKKPDFNSWMDYIHSQCNIYKGMPRRVKDLMPVRPKSNYSALS